MSAFIFPGTLTPALLDGIATGKTPFLIDQSIKKHLEDVHDRLVQRLNEGEAIYGVSTGFGPLVSTSVSVEDAVYLQHQLIHQLSVHTGDPLPWKYARAVAIARLNVLSKGASGARFCLLESLELLIKSEIAPKIPRNGSVGASGDLVPLSALAGTVFGRNKTGIDKNGNTAPIDPQIVIEPGPKEALAIVNGTSFSAAIVSLELVRIKRLFDRFIVPGALTFMFYMDRSIQHLAGAVYLYKSHPAVLNLVASVYSWLGDIRPEDSPGVPQPPYSSRTFMLWAGNALERLQHAHSLMETELNSVDDNPLFINDEILHAGNFQGTFTAHAADETTGAAVLLAQLMERQINRMLHPALNNGRPPFLAPQPAGLHSGLQGLQLLSTSLLADIRKQAVMHTAFSYPTNADNQDIVSMSATAANTLFDAGNRLEILVSAWLLTLMRLVQVGPEADLPAPLKEWLSQFIRFLDIDHKAVRYEDELAAFQKHLNG